MAHFDPAPAFSSPPFDPVLGMMRSQEAGPTSVGQRMLVLGGIIMLASSVAIGTAIAFLLFLAVGTSGIGAGGWIAVLLLAQVIYGVILVRRTNGRLYADVVLLHRRPTSGKPFRLLPESLHSIEALMIGPQLAFGGFQRIKAHPADDWDAFLTRCAAMIHTLAAAGEAMPALKLVVPGELPNAFDQTLDHLDRRDWIGFSSDRQRVWLSSKAQSDLVKLGVAVPAKP